MTSHQTSDVGDHSQMTQYQEAKPSDRSPSPDHSQMELPENFKLLSGNTKLAKAKVIFLGEAHIAQHRKDIVNFINNHSKSGDIVLVEGIQAGEEWHKDAYAHLASDTLKDEFRPLTQDVKIYGWDNIILCEKHSDLVRQFDLLQVRLDQLTKRNNDVTIRASSEKEKIFSNVFLT